MAAGKNYNLVTKTVRAKGTTGSAVAIGSSVAAGMKRYITYVRINQAAGGKGLGSKIWFCSTAASSTASTTAAANTAMKLMVLINSAANAGVNKVVELPEHPDAENPLFTIAASRWLSVRTSKLQLGSASCSIFVQYYDQ